jgi:quinol-cytochrome oxidoreductase complex cytochrome b subunit
MSEAELNNQEETIPFYPDHVKTEFYVVIGTTVVVMIVGLIGLFMPLGLGEPADPMNTPAHAKPEWYFLFLYQLLKYIPKSAGAVGPVLALILITIWPFIDRKPDKSRRAYRSRFIIAGVIIIIVIALTIWGEVG